MQSPLQLLSMQWAQDLVLQICWEWLSPLELVEELLSMTNRLKVILETRAISDIQLLETMTADVIADVLVALKVTQAELAWCVMRRRTAGKGKTL